MKIILTGGGTAGHVNPNIALIEPLKNMGYDIYYIGSETGIEKQLVKDIPYYEIPTGKLRRYISVKNFTDIFKIIKGFLKSLRIISQIKPDIVFSKGGFVVVPVLYAAWFKRIKIIIHESDITLGLASRLTIPIAKTICYSFPETKLPKRAILTGLPIRADLLNGSKQKGLEITGLNLNKPIILFMGGSMGSAIINDCLRGCLQELLKDFQIIHLCGKGNMQNIYLEGYVQFEYTDIADLYAIADMVVSRAGATTVFELLELCKPNILIPLSKKASRGDQMLNAKSFELNGFSYVLQEEDLKNLDFAIKQVYKNKDMYIKNMKAQNKSNATQNIINLI